MIMKRIILLCIGAIALFSGCSNDSDAPEPTDNEITAVAQVLNGRFFGTLYSQITNTTETEEITFSQYSSTKEIVSILDGTVVAYGTAVVTTYTNDHLLEVSKNCYYSIQVAYTGAQPTVSFYPHSDSGEINSKEDKRIITILSNSSFKMRKYGLSVNNDKTFTKQ